MTITNGVDADRLKAFIGRIERLEEEKAGIAADIKDVYAELKGCGYDVKTVRQVIKLRKIEADDREEQEQLLDLYKHALGMLEDLPLGAAAIEREFSPVRKAVRKVQAGAQPMVSLDGKGGMPLDQFIKVANALESPIGRAVASGFIAGAKLEAEKAATLHNPETGEITEPVEVRALDGIANAENSAVEAGHHPAGAPLHSVQEPAPQSIEPAAFCMADPSPQDEALADAMLELEAIDARFEAGIAAAKPYRITDPAPAPAAPDPDVSPLIADKAARMAEAAKLLGQGSAE